MVPVEDWLLWSLCLTGKRYVFGVENDAVVTRILRDRPSGRVSDPELAAYTTAVAASDCSELVQNACDLAGVVPRMPDGSWLQARHCHTHGLGLSVDTAIRRRGALLFKFSSDPFTASSRPRTAHVAVSLGDGTTIEARGKAWGVGSFPANGRGWTHAALVPGIDYTPPPIVPAGVTLPEYDPPLGGVIVSACPDPQGGSVLLAVDGAIYAVAGSRYCGGPYGHGYWEGRTGARVRVRPGAAWTLDDPGYEVVATSGEPYGAGGFGQS